MALWLPLYSYERLAWSLCHVLGGAVILVVLHCRATVLAISDEVDITFVDCLAWPPKAWSAVVQRLPQTSPQVNMAITAIMAILLSLFVLRSVPYAAIFKSNQPPPKYESAIMKTVAQAKAAG